MIFETLLKTRTRRPKLECLRVPKAINNTSRQIYAQNVRAFTTRLLLFGNDNISNWNLNLARARFRFRFELLLF